MVDICEKIKEQAEEYIEIAEDRKRSTMNNKSR